MVRREIGRITLLIDEEDGTYDLVWGGRSRLAGIGPWIRMGTGGDYRVGEGLRFSGWKAEKGSDPLGGYEEFLSTYDLTAGTKERGNSITACLRVYADRPLVYAAVGVSGGLQLDPECLGGMEVRGLPSFKRGTIFTGEPRPRRGAKGPFPSEINRVINVHLSRPDGFPVGACFLIWEDDDSLPHAAVPLNVHGLRGWVGVEGGRLILGCSSFDATCRVGSMPLAVLGFGDDPYRLTESTYRAALHLMGQPTYHRREKPYPEVFDSLGWCSWEGFKMDVSEESLIRVAEHLRRVGVPARYFLIDNGWLTVKERRLCSFEADGEKFPGGLGATVRRLKGLGVPHVGVWITLQGYWEGVHPESELFARYEDALFQGADGRYIPSPRSFESFRFYHDLCECLREQGIDFIKVDNQTDIVSTVRDRVPLDEAGRNLLHALQAAVNLHLRGLINCMAMGLHCAYHWLASNVTRDSEDYRANDKDRAKVHIMHSVFNALWFSQLVYPDYDMFHSSDEFALSHAVSRAISGGPIYISDVPWEGINTGLVTRLCLRDGTALRPDDPALPTRDTIFSDPYTEPVPLKAFTRAGDVGVVAAFNLNRDGAEETARVSPGDAEMEGEGEYAVYAYLADELRVVGRDESVERTLKELDCELFIISPIKEGFAPIGLIDVFMAPKGASSVDAQDGEVGVTLRQGGTFAAYLRERDVEIYADGEKCKRVEGQPLKQNSFTLRDGLLKAKIKGKQLTIRRRRPSNTH